MHYKLIEIHFAKITEIRMHEYTDTVVPIIDIQRNVYVPIHAQEFSAMTFDAFLGSLGS